MTDADRDQNRVRVALAQIGETSEVAPLKVDPISNALLIHVINVSEPASPVLNNGKRDSNRIMTELGISSSDDSVIVPFHTDSRNNYLWINESFLTNGLIGYWNLDEETGNALDSINNNDGVVTGATQNQEGKVNTAYAFDGNDHIAVPQNGYFNLSNGAFSIALWVLDNTPRASLTTYHRVISWYDGLKNIQVGLGQNNTPGRAFYLFNSASIAPVVAITTGDVSAGWHHIVATFDGVSTYKIYMDGVDASGGVLVVGVGVFTGNNTTLYIGQRGDNNGYVIGKIDEVRIYNRVLNSNEIEDIYNLT